MTLKFAALFAAWLGIACPFVQAQDKDVKLSGVVLNSAGKPAGGATVILLTARDSAVYKTSMTNPEGGFAFANLSAGVYQALVTLVGYKNYKSQPIVISLLPVTLPDIRMIADVKTLALVSVSAQKPLVERLVDRTVVNVDARISNAGSTILDVLAKSPGVQINENGGINLEGKGVTIYLDDRPTYLSGDDLAAYLRSLPSSTIDRIELMTTPPAKYDAAGSGGIINIRTKRITDVGFNGNLNLAYTQGVYARSNDGLNLNYRINKFNLAFNSGYSRNNNYNDVNLNRYFDSDVTAVAPDFIQQSYNRREGNNYNGRLNIDYYATAQTTLGIGLKGLLNDNQSHLLGTSRLSNGNELDSFIIADNLEHRQFKNGGINLNYRHAYARKGEELTADLDYITYRMHVGQDFANNSFFPDSILYYQDTLTGDLPSHIDIYAAKTDYNRPLAHGIKFSAGLKSSYTATNNIADYFNTVAQITSPDYNATNHFIYKENINAAYVNAAKNFKRLSVQAGLRFENTNADGRQLGNALIPDSSFSRNYNGFFPTLFVQYRLDSASRQRLTFKYGRRVERPYYANLNPFLFQLDKFTFNEGNPYLLPSYTDNYELDYDFLGIGTGLAFSRIRDKTDGLVQIINGYYYSKPGNIGNTYQVIFDAEWQKDLAKWFNIYIYGRLMYQRTVTNFFTGPLDTQGTQWYINPVLTFKPGKNWNIETDGYYQSGIPSEQFIDAPKKSIGLAISKKLSSSVTLKLAGNDLFHTVANSWTIGYLAGTSSAAYHSVSDTRNLVISIGYRFGKTINNLRKHEDTATKAEQGRVN